MTSPQENERPTPAPQVGWPSHGHDLPQDRLAACPSGPPSPLCGSAALSMVVFGQVKETGAASLYLMKAGPAL